MIKQTNLNQWIKTETEEITVKYVEKNYISDIDGLKQFSLIKFENENEINLNIIENGKHAGHKTIINNPYVNEIFNMEADEIKVGGTEMNGYIIKCKSTETGAL